MYYVRVSGPVSIFIHISIKRYKVTSVASHGLSLLSYYIIGCLLKSIRNVTASLVAQRQMQCEVHFELNCVRVWIDVWTGLICTWHLDQSAVVNSPYMKRNCVVNHFTENWIHYSIVFFYFTPLTFMN